jgi:hypothetical protein
LNEAKTTGSAPARSWSLPVNLSFFIEVIIHLFPELSKVDLTLLEKDLLFLKELKARGYSISSQDDNFITCQKSVKPEGLIAEYEVLKLIASRTC